MNKILSAVVVTLVSLTFTTVVFAKDDEKPIVIAKPAAVSAPASDVQKADTAEKKAETDRNAATSKARTDANAAKDKGKSDANKAINKAESDADKAISKARSDVKGAK